MDTKSEKVYVAVGNDLQEGIGTLEWALRKWSGQTISIVIIHFNNNNKDFVYTPFGKLPASSVNDEKLRIFRMYEQEKTDKLLSKYIDFCAKVRTGVLKVEKTEEPIYKVIVGLISRLRVTKFVMGITLMKSQCWKTKSAISAAFYVHKNKPNFCESFIICGGELIFLGEGNEEGFVEDDQGLMVAKLRNKVSFKGWLGRAFTDSTAIHQSCVRDDSHCTLAAASMGVELSLNSHERWENYAEEVENYLQWLSISEVGEEFHEEENGPAASQLSLEKELEKLQQASTKMSQNASDRIGAMRAKTEEARKMTEEKRKEVKIHVERQRRAERIISLCNRRVEELDARINEESTTQNDLKKDLEAAREYIYEVSSDIEETKSKLSSIMELKAELTRKLHSSSLAKFHAESQLQNAMAARTELLLEIDELRRERGLLRRRVEFCREKEAIAAATASSNSLNYAYREFTADEIRVATDDFSERMRLKSGGVGTNVYRGRLNHTTVAIKLQDSLCRQSQEELRTKMELLCKIRHPHLISMIGACTERRCIILEYMHNGSLQDILFFSSNSKSNRSRNRTLPWHARIRIAAEICSGLSFLHMAEPRSIVHGDLNPSKVLLDRHLVAKLTGFRLGRSPEESEKRSDAHAFGIIMLQLLTGRQGAGLVEEVTRAMKCGALIGVLDETTAREWPLELAEKFAGIALRCVDVGGKQRMETRRATVMRELEELKRKASDVMGWRGSQTTEGGLGQEDDRDVPSVFLCPILQEVMKNPHVAADGFSYEWEAIEEWLRTGHETSPMTNLRLNHKLLTPNHTLRSLIHDWLNKT